MWDLICKEWENSTNCHRDENQMIHLKSHVKHSSAYKEKLNGSDCLYFVAEYTNYTNQCKAKNGDLFKMANQLNTLNFIIAVVEHIKSDPKRVLCPKNPKFQNNGSFKFTCTGSVNDDNVMNLIVEPAINDAKATSHPQFWYFFLALAISWIGMAVVVSVGDAICFDLLGKRSELYGRQRLWGAVGFGIFNLMAGFWIDFISGQQAYKNYSVIYYLMAAALLPNTMVSSCLEVSDVNCICFSFHRLTG